MTGMVNGRTQSSGVSIVDVARRVGMSPSTVSLGLRSDPRIKESTRRLVQMVANQMNYRPKASARALAGGRTHTIGVVFADSGPTAHTLACYASTLKTITATLAKRDYFVSLASWSEGHEALGEAKISLPRMFRESGIEAALIIRTPGGPLLEQTLWEQRLPFVMIDAAKAPRRVTVAVNERLVAEKAVEHLVQLGHRRIFYEPQYRHVEAGPYAIPRISEFPRGYAGAMAVAGLVPNPGWDEALPIGGYEPLLEDWFRSSDSPTALIAYDDIGAAFVISWLVCHGIKVPADVSVVSLHSMDVLAGDFLLNMYPTRGVTSPRNMQEQLAELAVEKLMYLTENRNEEVESVLLEPELVARGSTGPCTDKNNSRPKEMSS